MLGTNGWRGWLGRGCHCPTLQMGRQSSQLVARELLTVLPCLMTARPARCLYHVSCDPCSCLRGGGYEGPKDSIRGSVIPVLQRRKLRLSRKQGGGQDWSIPGLLGSTAQLVSAGASDWALELPPPTGLCWLRALGASQGQWPQLPSLFYGGRGCAEPAHMGQ